jgi:acetyl-CoA acetyltransferase family protein
MSQLGREVVIAEAVRIPVGRGHKEKGYYKDTHAADLLAASYGEVVRRSGIDPSQVELAISGCVQQLGEQSFNISRNAWLQEGLPQETSAFTLDLQCGSAQQAVGLATALIATGVHDVVVAGGVEHMGHISFADGEEVWKTLGSPYTDTLMSRYDLVGQGLGAELIADEYEISRAEMDELALRSHQLAHKATEEGLYEREMVPMAVDGTTVMTDQGIRPTTSLESLAELKPVFKPDGKITAGNASQVSDGSAALLLTTPEKAQELGLTVRARIVDQTSVGCDPIKMLEGPIPATRKILERNKMSIGDIELFEVSEAFAPVVIAWARELKPDMDRVNTRGGAMAIGHPLGSTGGRLITSLLHAMEDEDKEIGLVTMCCGGGLGTATLIERA